VAAELRGKRNIVGTVSEGRKIMEKGEAFAFTSLAIFIPL
jgi:hypothetical protein